MDDDIVGNQDSAYTNRPPTKQLLSETKLFKKFGSLHLDKCHSANSSSNSSSSDDDQDDFEMAGSSQSSQTNYDTSTADKDDINKYVYILFKDKKVNSSSPSFQNCFETNTTLDRLARQERDKLSKAVVLWNPPARNPYTVISEDDDEDEEFKYTDHRDFLKDQSRSSESNDSIIITDVTNEDNLLCNSGNSNMQTVEPDELMFD